MSAQDMPVAERPHFVYRIYDAADRLLYIGCARDVQHRINLHCALTSALEASWTIRRAMARHTAEEFPNRAAARAAERAAIEAEAPLLNKQHNPRRFRKAADMSYRADP